jgi:hypothetical protein
LEAGSLATVLGALATFVGPAPDMYRPTRARESVLCHASSRTGVFGDTTLFAMRSEASARVRGGDARRERSRRWRERSQEHFDLTSAYANTLHAHAARVQCARGAGSSKRADVATLFKTKGEEWPLTATLEFDFSTAPKITGEVVFKKWRFEAFGA